MTAGGLVPLLSIKSEVFQGPDLAKRVGAFLSGKKLERVILVTDPGVAALPIFKSVTLSLTTEGMEVFIFDQVQADPSLDLVKTAVGLAGTGPWHAVISLGGGSSVDAAKAIGACIASGCGPAELFQSPPDITLPHLALPTTAGTGAEVSNSAILTDTEGGKRALISNALPADWVFLDPEAIIGQQPALAFSCGVDALSHGLESLVSKESNALSRMMSRECIRLIVENLGPFTDEPTLDRAAKLQIGALLGGVALKHARLGYAHALGHALAAYRHIPHGESIARVLPAVMKFNQDCATSQYQTVARQFRTSEDVGLDRIIADYLSKCGLPIGITDLNLSTEEIQAIAARCAAGPFHRWNPRPAEEDDFITLLNQMNT